VNIQDALFSNNRSIATFSGGGAILNGRGELTVIDSVFIGNQSSALGGALVAASNTTTIIRSKTCRRRLRHWFLPSRGS
jgi:predicted outer membrane repeat protein